ncbi:MAG: SBBP repeat-containing protein, partial [Anaerolineaceae bacterium]
MLVFTPFLSLFLSLPIINIKVISIYIETGQNPFYTHGTREVCMKTFHGGSQYFKMSLVSLIIIITLMLQAFAPGAAIGSAGTDQSNKTVNKGAGSDLLSNAASDVLIRPIIEQKAAVLGDRHSSSEPDIDIEQTESRPDTSFLFVENVGQFDPKEIFQMKQKSSYMRFSRDSIWITLLEPDDPFASSLNPSADGNDRIDKKQKGVNIQIDFVDSNKQPDIEGFDRSESKVSYFYGNDENNWRPDVPVWNGIRYIDLYPGIDLEISNNSGALAWQLVVRDSNRLLEWINKKSGNDIRFQVKGTQSISLNSQTLQFTSAIGELFLPQMQIVWADGDPLGIGTIAPQVGDNEYILISNDHFGKIAANNGPEAQEQTAETQAPAVPDGTGMVDGDIQTFDTTYVWDFTNDSDAMRLMETSGMVWGTVFSTILGTNAVASDIIVDSEGYSYVVGYTSGATFPTTPGAFQTSMNGNRDGFVSKINPFGSSLIYSTFFGGSSTDEVFSVALDDVGSAYITGWSISWDFPATYGAFQTGNYGYDAFVTKLN